MRPLSYCAGFLWGNDFTWGILCIKSALIYLCTFHKKTEFTYSKPVITWGLMELNSILFTHMHVYVFIALKFRLTNWIIRVVYVMWHNCCGILQINYYTNCKIVDTCLKWLLQSFSFLSFHFFITYFSLFFHLALQTCFVCLSYAKSSVNFCRKQKAKKPCSLHTSLHSFY